MDIKAVLEKVKKGEALDDAEKKALSEFDLQKHIDGAQAEARRKAEAALETEKQERAKLAAQIADLEQKVKAKEGEKLSVTEQLQRALSDLQQKFDASEKRSTDLAAAQAKANRSAKVQDLAKKFGVSFIDGVDARILTGALEGTLSSVENLEDENLVKPIVESFKTANKAVIRDQSGGGGGTPPRDGSCPRGLDGKPVSEMSAAEREKDLKSRSII